MITIGKDLVKKCIEYKKLRDYLKVVTDLKQEEKLIQKQDKLYEEVQKLNNEFTQRDINEIISSLAFEEVEENFYLYNQDNIIETLFPSIGKKNNYIQSAYYWIDEKCRIDWIFNNVLCDNKYYDVVENINYKYILSKEKLSNII